MATNKKQKIYFSGLHCKNCEILVTKKINELAGVKVKEINRQQGWLEVNYEQTAPNINNLNNLFTVEKYQFATQAFKTKAITTKDWLFVGLSLVIIIGIFFSLNRLGIDQFFNLSDSSSLLTFLVFGLLAGISTCAALVGGIILALSRQWQAKTDHQVNFFKKFQPVWLFNLGRLIAFGVGGYFLGWLGQSLQISLDITVWFIIAVSLIMLIIGLKGLGLKLPSKKILPDKFTKFITQENNFTKAWSPAVMGALSFFVPCGFTIAVQSLALLAPSPLQASLMMLFFALGTAPALVAIGLFGLKIYSIRASLIISFILIFLAIYNINSQFNILGWPNLNNLTVSQTTNQQLEEDGWAPMVNGKQVIKMEAYSFKYDPSYFKVRVGVPVRWEIADQGTSGCTNAVISRDLFTGSIPLTRGQISVKEFTPTKVGRYPFSCWMGMVSGTIEVADPNN